jgi:hypothetical protein
MLMIVFSDDDDDDDDCCGAGYTHDQHDDEGFQNQNH